VAVVTLLAGADLYEWIALRRVSGNGVARLGDCWLESGHREPSYVTEALTELLAGGLVALADQDPCGLRRAALTDAGTVRYEWLGQQRQIAVQVPVPGSAPPASGLVCTTPTPPHGMTLPD
jgi:hypothetical protein